MRFLPVLQWIHIGVATGKQNSVEVIKHSGDVFRIWYQADVRGDSTRRMYRLAVVSGEIEPIGLKFDAHRYADAW